MPTIYNMIEIWFTINCTGYPKQKNYEKKPVNEGFQRISLSISKVWNYCRGHRGHSYHRQL